MMLRWLRLSAIVVVLDQASKQLVSASLQLYELVPLLPHFNLVLAHNEGAAFSMLSDQGGWQRWFFTLLATIVSGILLLWLKRLQPDQRRLAIGLSLIIGGALGNLIDRVVHGYVIDFLDFYYGSWHWPAFNLADSAIFLGVFLFILDNFLQKPEAPGR